MFNTLSRQSCLVLYIHSLINIIKFIPLFEIWFLFKNIDILSLSTHKPNISETKVDSVYGLRQTGIPPIKFICIATSLFDVTSLLIEKFVYFNVKWEKINCLNVFLFLKFIQHKYMLQHKLLLKIVCVKHEHQCICSKLYLH